MESNKLIEEFMGWNTKSLTTIPSNLHLSNLQLDNGDVMELKFHIEWNWLMPVIKKCLVGEAEQSEELVILSIQNIYEGICNQDIEYAHKSVVEFIKQYNKTK